MRRNSAGHVRKPGARRLTAVVVTGTVLAAIGGTASVDAAPRSPVPYHVASATRQAPVDVMGHRSARPGHRDSVVGYPVIPTTPLATCNPGSAGYAYYPAVSDGGATFDPTKECYIAKSNDGPGLSMTGPVMQTISPGQSFTLGSTSNYPDAAAWLLYWYQFFDPEPLMRGSNGQPNNGTSGYASLYAIPPTIDGSGCHVPNSTSYNYGRFVSSCPIKVISGPYYGTPVGQTMPWTIFTASSTGGGYTSPIVTNSSGERWSWTPSFFELPVFLQPSPYAGYSWLQGAPGVQFTDKTLSDLPVTSWVWDFGDGQTSNQKSPLHVYAHPGTWTTKLTVTTNDGQTSTSSQTITTINENPTLSGTVLDLSGHSVQTKLQLTDTDTSTSQTVATDLNGAYSVTVPTGNYTLIPDPNLPAGLITPATQSFNLTADTTANLTFNGHRLNLSVTNGAGTAINGVSITVSGSGTVLGLPAVTDSNGAAHLEVTDGAYTAAPVDPQPSQNNTFTPPSGQATVSGADASLPFVFNAGPAVFAVAPNTGPVAGGTTVNISGVGFQDIGSPVTTVAFATSGGPSVPAASFTVVNANTITATTPNVVQTLQPGATSVPSDVVVTTSSASSALNSGDAFVFGNVPTVTSVAPSSGIYTGGTKVVVSGTHFTGYTGVAFKVGSTALSGKSIVLNSDTQITVTSPALSKGLSAPQTADVVVTTPDGSSPTGAADKFKFRPPNVVQLGDSIASGEGINYLWSYDPSTETWTDAQPYPTWDGAYQTCHNSLLAYGYKVAANLQNGNFTTFACTGATYEKGVGGPKAEGSVTVPAQFGSVGTVNPAYDAAAPDVVLVSLGADDIAFSDVVGSCIANAIAYTSHLSALQCVPTNPGSSVLNNFTANIPGIGTHLTKLADDIMANGAASPTGVVPKIVFNDYFNPFPTGTCPDLGTLYPAQVKYLISLEKVLNAKIRNTVKALSASHANIGFVELQNAFNGHQWCSNSPYAYGLSIVYTDLVNALGVNPSPFHPTPAGQAVIAGLVTTEAQKLLKK
jgi:PKD repeat protein